MMRLMLSALLSSAALAFAPQAAFRTQTSTSIVASTVSRLNPTVSSTGLNAMLQQTELPEKLYFPQEKEVPKVLGGLKIGLRKLVVITGASSGLGLNCAVTLAKTGRYFVVMACRDIEKGKRGRYLILIVILFINGGS